MAGFVADIMSVINVALSFLGNSTGITSLSTGFLNFAKGIYNGILAFKGLLTTMAVFAALSALGHIVKNTISCVLGFFPCLMEEIFLQWPLRIWNNVFMYTFMWLFIDAMTFPDPCLFFWLAYLFFLMLYYFIFLILSIIQMDSVLDMMYQFLQSIDMMDITGGKLYFTRFSDSVIDKCFTTADMYYLLYFEFSRCSCPDIGLNVSDVQGIPKGTQGKLHQWSD